MQKSKLSGVKEIARRAKVSIGTVDRVIHNRKGVSEDTRKKISQIIKELQFKPNKMASLLASRKSFTIAILIPKVSPETDFWDYPLSGINQAGHELRQFGITIERFLYDLDDVRSFQKAAEKMLNSTPAAILLAPSFVEESRVLVKKIQERQIPVVFINSDLPGQPGLAYIGPELYQSGRLAAQISCLSIQPSDDVMVINISTDLENDHHLRKKEQGFRSFFKDGKRKNRITTLNIPQTGFAAVEKSILGALRDNPDLTAFFVTNSRVNIIARILKKHRKSHLLVGYDFLKRNVGYLVEGQIDFLICQRPKEQGYLAVMALYRHLFHLGDPEQTMYMPIDIITRENYQFYKS